jgi:addiction module RelE/StbE family toxin
MVAIVYSDGFFKSAKKLPVNIKKKLAKLLSFLEQYPYHPLLHSKHLTGELAGFLSFRITRDYRVIFRFLDSNTVQLIRAANRKDIYR